MAFDYRKEYKEFYLPSRTPSLVEVPAMSFAAVSGSGDPNIEGGQYKTAVGKLYALAFTVKMSKLGDRRIDGYFDYVVPPLEGLWMMDGVDGIDYTRKADFRWTSLIRLPDFVSAEDFEWARENVRKRKGLDMSDAENLRFCEGLCVQCMHIGPFDDEPETVALMDAFVRENGLAPDFSGRRRHHEIYLSDARKTAPDRLRTVIRHPVKRV